MVLTNVLGPALLVKAALPHLTAPGGQIVLVGSVAGRIIRPGSLYGATKAAVAALAENLRPQLTASGIRVALVEPGITDTPFWGEAGAPPFALEADGRRRGGGVHRRPAGRGRRQRAAWCGRSASRSDRSSRRPARPVRSARRRAAFATEAASTQGHQHRGQEGRQRAQPRLRGRARPRSRSTATAPTNSSGVSPIRNSHQKCPKAASQRRDGRVGRVPVAQPPVGLPRRPAGPHAVGGTAPAQRRAPAARPPARSRPPAPGWPAPSRARRRGPPRPTRTSRS